MNKNYRIFTNFGWGVFAFAILLLIWYLAELYFNDILGFGKFDVSIINTISPFFNNIFLSIITIVSLIFVYANLLEFTENNKRTIDDKKIEFALIQVGNFFKEIQPKLAEASNKGIFNGMVVSENYLTNNLKNIYTYDAIQYDCIKSKLQTHYADVLLLISLYENISSNLLNKHLCDLSAAKNIIEKPFTEQLKKNHLLGYISLLRFTQPKYAENTLLLYQEWGGELGEYFDKDNFE